MGDRVNVFVKDADVFLYGHWSGYEMAAVVRDALKRGADRWTDSYYLARIIFCEMVKGDEMGLTGFGISHRIGDNGRPVIVVDPTTCTVAVTSKRGHAVESGDVAAPVRAMPFAEFIKLSDEQARAWHFGEVSP